MLEAILIIFAVFLIVTICLLFSKLKGDTVINPQKLRKIGMLVKLTGMSRCAARLRAAGQG